MKDCPECGEQVADDAVHCGHCGAKVEEERSEKKTMFGVGTVDADSLKSAVDEAQGKGGEEHGEEQAGREGATDDEASSDDDGGSGGFRLPTPGEAGAETGDEGEENTPVGLSTDEESTVEASSSDLPEPGDVGDGRLSAPDSESEVDGPAEDTAVQPDEGVEVGDEPMLGETLSMESPPEVQQAGDAADSQNEVGSASREETTPEEAADTVPTDMSPPAGDAGAEAEDEDELDVPGELAPTRREVETVDDEPGGDQSVDGDDGSETSGEQKAERPSGKPDRPTDSTGEVDSVEEAEAGGEDDEGKSDKSDSTIQREAASSEPATGEHSTAGDRSRDSGPAETPDSAGPAAGSDSQPEVAASEETGEASEQSPTGQGTPSASAGSRFEQADETAPPQTADQDAESQADGRISTKTLLFIAAGLFAFCAVGCAGVLGLFYAGYL